MNITIVKDAILPVNKYGGTERVIWALGKELTRMGHQVTYLLHKGSSCNFAKIIEIDYSKGIYNQIPEDTDIVHFQDLTNIDEISVPYVVTINGNPPAGTQFMPNSIFVSKNHAERYGRESFVYNGLDWDDYGVPDLSKQRKGFHFLGKAAWKVKNVNGAINITKKIRGATLEVLGGYRLNFKMGFRFTLNPRIHFHGMVNNEQKKLYIEQSEGLIFPIKWNEPFGLCLIESLYYGAPVYGTRMGSLPEIVTADVGWLGNNEQHITDFLNTFPSYSPQTCHEYASDLFNAHVMAVAYLDKYGKVLNGEQLK